MISCILNCKIITPMFCYGADGQTPELRAPSLKGALRFWWRAIHPNLRLDYLRSKETEIFGGVGDNEAKKSSFSIMIINRNFEKGKYQPLPHHDNSSYCNNCEKRNGKCKKSYPKDDIMPNSTYEIIIRPKNEEIEKLLKLASILGGIGARSRRGFGCFQIESIDDKEYNFDLNEDNLFEKINEINPNFEKGKEYERDYPYLQKVEIGKPNKDYNELLKKIGRASHKFDTPYTGTTDNRFVNSGRYASPIYVSIYKQSEAYFPIISTLKRTINDTNNHKRDEENKNKFIQAILGGA